MSYQYPIYEQAETKILLTIFSLLLSKIRIRIGEWDFSSTSEPHKNVERKVTKKIVHPDYNFFTYENDLALLKLEKRVTFQDNIIPICLPANDDLLVGKCASTEPMIHINQATIFRKRTNDFLSFTQRTNF